MRSVNRNNLGEYITKDCQLQSWGGTDEYKFSFEPEKQKIITPPTPPSSSDDERSQTTNRKVCVYTKAIY